MRSNPNRRSVVSGIAAATVFTLAGGLPALALSESEAEKLVDRAVLDINRIISSGKSEAGMIQDFESVFERHADVQRIARSALGVDARSASEAQIAAFTRSFKGYLSRKYGKRFREFIGGRIQVQRTKKVKRYYEVRTTAFLQGEAPFTVDFHVIEISGKAKFVNMLIEGVNMVLAEKREIGALLDARGGNLNRLIEDLKKLG